MKMEAMNFKVFYGRKGDEPNIRRFSLPIDVAQNYSDVREKLVASFSETDHDGLNMYWTDSDGDMVIFSSQEEYEEVIANMADNMVKITLKEMKGDENPRGVAPLEKTDDIGRGRKWRRLNKMNGERVVACPGNKSRCRRGVTQAPTDSMKPTQDTDTIVCEDRPVRHMFAGRRGRGCPRQNPTWGQWGGAQACPGNRWEGRNGGIRFGRMLKDLGFNRMAIGPEQSPPSERKMRWRRRFHENSSAEAALVEGLKGVAVTEEGSSCPRFPRRRMRSDHGPVDDTSFASCQRRRFRQMRREMKIGNMREMGVGNYGRLTDSPVSGADKSQRNTHRACQGEPIIMTGGTCVISRRRKLADFPRQQPAARCCRRGLRNEGQTNNSENAETVSGEDSLNTINRKAWRLAKRMARFERGPRHVVCLGMKQPTGDRGQKPIVLKLHLKPNRLGNLAEHKLPNMGHHPNERCKASRHQHRGTVAGCGRRRRMNIAGILQRFPRRHYRHGQGHQDGCGNGRRMFVKGCQQAVNRVKFSTKLRRAVGPQEICQHQERPLPLGTPGAFLKAGKSYSPRMDRGQMQNRMLSPNTRRLFREVIQSGLGLHARSPLQQRKIGMVGPVGKRMMGPIKARMEGPFRPRMTGPINM